MSITRPAFSTRRVKTWLKDFFSAVQVSFFGTPVRLFCTRIGAFLLSIFILFWWFSPLLFFLLLLLRLLPFISLPPSLPTLAPPPLRRDIEKVSISFFDLTLHLCLSVSGSYFLLLLQFYISGWSAGRTFSPVFRDNMCLFCLSILKNHYTSPFTSGRLTSRVLFFHFN